MLASLLLALRLYLAPAVVDQCEAGRCLLVRADATTVMVARKSLPKAAHEGSAVRLTAMGTWTLDPFWHEPLPATVNPFETETETDTNPGPCSQY